MVMSENADDCLITATNVQMNQIGKNQNIMLDRCGSYV